jgi:hypothetical protein
MSGMGPPPAENRRRTNKDTFAEAAVTVPADAEVDAPELPGWESYSTETLRWYNTWCKAPQAAAFTVTDWQRLHMLAPLVDEYWSKPTAKLMGEIRLNEALLGATHLDRMRGRIKIGGEKPAAARPGKGVADLTAARRKRMTDAS